MIPPNQNRRDVKVTSLHICTRPGKRSQTTMERSQNQLFRLGHVQVRFLYVYQAGSIPFKPPYFCWLNPIKKPSFIPSNLLRLIATWAPRHNDACGAVPPSNTWSSGAWWLPGGVFMVIFTKNLHFTRDFTVFSPSMGWLTMGKWEFSWDWVLISSNLSWSSYHIWYFP